MSNRLAEETSPYLLQHSDNSVNWYPWGEEALNHARAEDKPIRLLGWTLIGKTVALAPPPSSPTQ